MFLMKLHPVDITMVLVYLLIAVLIGVWVSRRGAKDLNSCSPGGILVRLILTLVFLKFNWYDKLEKESKSPTG